MGQDLAEIDQVGAGGVHDDLAGLDRAGIKDGSAFGDEFHHPVMLDEVIGLDDPSIIDGIVEHLVQGLGGQGDLAAVGQDRTTVLDRGIDLHAVGPEDRFFHAFIDRDRDQTPVIHRDRHLLAGGQDNVSDLGVDARDRERSAVINGLRKERDVTARLRRDPAGVLDK